MLGLYRAVSGIISETVAKEGELLVTLFGLLSKILTPKMISFLV